MPVPKPCLLSGNLWSLEIIGCVSYYPVYFQLLAQSIFYEEMTLKIFFNKLKLWLSVDLKKSKK